MDGWGDSILTAHGNDWYKVVKELEPVCIGVYFKEYDALPESD